MPETASRRGLIYGLSAYLLWGLLPLYWKQIQSVPPLEIICHRIAWSLVFTGLLLGLRGGVLRTLGECRSPRVALAMTWTAFLLGINWLLFIYAVNSGQVLQSSLGYFISPLVNAALGMAVLRERLSPAQKVAFLLALGGVLVLAFAAGQPPWLALALAVTFGLYGLGRKVSTLGSLDGLFVESAILALPALAWLLVLEARGVGAFGHAQPYVSGMLAGAGVVTSIPLILFAAAARRMPLTALGLLQYLSPSMQFLMGVLLFHEPFGTAQLVAFALIWSGLALFTFSSLQTPEDPALQERIEEAR